MYQLDHINPASYPSSAINSGLNQQDYYGVLALNGALGSKTDYQLAYTAHYNSQTFYPDPIGDLDLSGHLLERLHQRSLQHSCRAI